MAKKKFHRITIKPADAEHYHVHHEPQQEPSPMGGFLAGNDEKHGKIFHKSKREDMHKHLDQLLDAHEGVKDSPAEEQGEPVSQDHPMNKLKMPRKREGM